MLFKDHRLKVCPFTLTNGFESSHFCCYIQTADAGEERQMCQHLTSLSSYLVHLRRFWQWHPMRWMNNMFKVPSTKLRMESNKLIPAFCYGKHSFSIFR